MNIDHPFSAFVASSDYWAWETDGDLRLIYLSPNFEALTGISPDPLMGTSRMDMFGCNAAEDFWAEHRHDLLSRRSFRCFRFPVTLANGKQRWFESSGTPRFDGGGIFLGYRGIARDMTRDRHSEERLEWAGREIQMSEAVFHHVERIAKIGAWKYDMRSSKLEWSEEIYRIHELDPNSAVDLEFALGHFGDDARQAFESAVNRTIRTGDPFDVTLPLVTGKGTRKWVRALGEAVMIEERTVKLFGTFQDVTEERNRQDEIRRLAETDDLTGLANRAAFQDMARKAMAETAETSRYGALCLIDLDQFKQTNDHFGHAAGDAVLQATSAWLQSLSGPDARVARLGGDEFAMILTGFESAKAIDDAIGERFSVLLHKIEFQGRVLESRASVGYALFSQDGRDLEDLMANADLALYDAKSRGRRRISKYRESFGSNFARKMELIGAFKVALTKGEIVPYYQPIVELATGHVTGFEALARWIHPEKGVISAGAFSEVFDNQELVAEIGDVMIDAITTDMSRWKALGVEFGRIGMNVADANLLEPGFLLSISALLAKKRLMPKQLVLEITENTVFKSKASIVEILTNLRALGVLIALDDFGTGYSSLTHLQDIPFDILKIDKSFTQRVNESAASMAIVRSLVALGHSLGYTTVAEGIETDKDVESLLMLGSERAQGYYFAKPMPAGMLPEFMQSMEMAPVRRKSAGR